MQTKPVIIDCAYDKTGWGDGPWQTEADIVGWDDPETGLPCLIARADPGNLCGYVGVPAGHPWHGRQRADAHLDSAHWGCNYAKPGNRDAPEPLCPAFAPDPDGDDKWWWFGFDCGHAFDFSPAMHMELKAVLPPHLVPSTGMGTIYREMPYVMECVRAMASELHALATTNKEQAQ